MIVAIVVVGLVSYRIWRLLAVDNVTESVRRAIFGIGRPQGFRRHGRAWWEFSICAWCSGFWITGLVTLGWCLIEGSTNPVAIWLASSVVVGFLGERS